MKSKQQNVQENFPNLGNLTTEQLGGLAHKALSAYGEANLQSRKTSAEKKEIRERNIPVLRALRSRLSRRGNGGWQAWFEENKKDFGGVTVRTVNGWLGNKEGKPRFANLDGVDGISLAGRKYTFKVGTEGNGGTLTITAVPYVKEELAEQAAQSDAEPVAAPQKKAAAKTHAARIPFGAKTDVRHAYCGKSDADGSVLFPVGGKQPTCKVCLGHPEYQGMQARLRLKKNQDRRDKRRAAKAVVAKDTMIAEGVRIIDKLNGQLEARVDSTETTPHGYFAKLNCKPKGATQETQPWEVYKNVNGAKPQFCCRERGKQDAEAQMWMLERIADEEEQTTLITTGSSEAAEAAAM